MNIHLSKRHHNCSVEVINICSKMAETFTGSEIEMIANESASLAIKDAREQKLNKICISDDNLRQATHKAITDKQVEIQRKPRKTPQEEALMRLI